MASFDILLFASLYNLVPRVLVTLIQRPERHLFMPLDKGNKDSGNEIVHCIEQPSS